MIMKPSVQLCIICKKKLKEKNNVKHFIKQKLDFHKKLNSKSIPYSLKFCEKVGLDVNLRNSLMDVKDFKSIQVIILVN